MPKGVGDKGVGPRVWTWLKDLAERHQVLGPAELKAPLETLVTGVAVEGGEHPERRKEPVGTGASEGQVPTWCIKVSIRAAGSPTGSGVLTPLWLVGMSRTAGSPRMDSIRNWLASEECRELASAIWTHLLDGLINDYCRRTA